MVVKEKPKGAPFDYGMPGVDGQYQNYPVLPEAERAKGHVRPVRTAYVHVGQAICGDTTGAPKDRITVKGTVLACADSPGHDDECSVWQQVTPAEAARRRVGGCGAVTTMSRPLAETYAKDPSYYGATYCARCGGHFPVGKHGQFVWDGTEERVGT